MSPVHILKSTQKLPSSLEQVWGFFSDPRNLLAITPPQLNLKLSQDLFGAEIYPGQIMLYKVRPLLGLPVSWMTEITGVNKPVFFVDQQKKGPYKLWHHQHHFRSIEGGVEMTDLVHYRLPFGWLGNLAHGVVKTKLYEIFHYRYNRIIDVFGPWPGQQMELQLGK